MFDLCKFLNVEEGQIFKINGYKADYRITNNHLEMLNAYDEWTTNIAIDINDLINDGIRFPRKVLRKELINLLKLIDKEYKWIAKDKGGTIKLFENKPLKNDKGIWSKDGSFYIEIGSYIARYVFDDLSWQDEEPLCIDDYVERL